MWDTRPSTPHIQGDFSDGWLTFENEAGTVRRRLAPIPPGWETVPEAELRRLCAEATEQPRRSSRTGEAQSDDLRHTP